MSSRGRSTSSRRRSTSSREASTVYDEEDNINATRGKRSTARATVKGGKAIRSVAKLSDGSNIVWPEFTDAGVNSEKWVEGKRAKSPAKGKLKASASQKSATGGSLFTDPEVVNLRLHVEVQIQWIRPKDFFQLDPDSETKITVIEDKTKPFDLVKKNQHLRNNSTIRWIISTVSCLSDLSDNGETFFEHKQFGSGSGWKPWDHVYAMTRVGRGAPHNPQYNPRGKYVVRLYWMGAWRKILVDDQLPIDSEGRLLLPQTTKTELWPVVLSKAMLKVLGVNLGDDEAISVDVLNGALVHMLTGWVPETIPWLRISKRNLECGDGDYLTGLRGEIWGKCEQTTKEWVYVEEVHNPEEPEATATNGKSTGKAAGRSEPSEQHKSRDRNKSGRKAVGRSGSAGRSKSSGPSKSGGRSKSDGRGKQAVPRFAKPESVIFCTFSAESMHRFKQQDPALFDMDAFRRSRIEEGSPNPFLVSTHRKCKLEAPSKIDPPAWKLVRPRRERTRDDDDFLPLPEGDRGGEYWLLLKSPFIAKDARRESWEILAEEGEDGEEDEATVRSAWIHFQDFVESFDKLLIFHKPFTHNVSLKRTNLERLGNAWEILAKEKRSELASKMRPKLAEDRLFLFADNLSPIRIVVGFAGLCRWRPVPEEPVTAEEMENRCRCGEEEEAKAEEPKLSEYEKFRRRYCGIPIEENTTMVSRLSARIISWKLDGRFNEFYDIVSNEMKAKTMVLPAGRNVVELNSTAPLGFHSHLFSSAPFTVGTEVEIRPLLASESLRFKEFGVAFLQRILQFLSVFAEVGAENPPPEPKAEVDFCEKCSQQDLCQCVCVSRREVIDYTDWQKIPERYTLALNEIYEYITPPICCDGSGGGGACGAYGGCGSSGGCHWKCRVNFDEKWNSMLRGFYSFLRRILPATQQTTEMIFALRAAFLDLTETIFHVGLDRPPPKKGKSALATAEKVEEEDRKEEGEEETKEGIRVSQDEKTKVLAALDIQKSVKGHLTRKVLGARLAGSAAHKKAGETLVKLVKLIEPKIEEYGPSFLREMFKTHIDLYECYPFSRNDEKFTMYHADFHGTSLSASNSKCNLRFRTTFGIPEDLSEVNLVKFAVTSPKHLHRLRVIDNDSLSEMATLTEHSGRWYARNVNGYTLLCEAAGLPESEHWKFLMTANHLPLPAIDIAQLNEGLKCHAIRENYLPSRDGILFEYDVYTTAEKQLLTFHARTSHEKAFIKLTLSRGEEIISVASGKGFAVIPAVSLDGPILEETSEVSSGDKRESAQVEARIATPEATEGEETAVEGGENRIRYTIYRLKCEVLKTTWPLTKGEWNFAKDVLWNEEKEKRKFREITPEMIEDEISANQEEVPVEEGDGVDYALHNSINSLDLSLPDSNENELQAEEMAERHLHLFDSSRPYWTVEAFVRNSSKDSLVLRPVFSKRDEILGLKASWEEEEEGRCLRSAVIRHRYIQRRRSANMTPLEEEEGKETSTIEIENEAERIDEASETTLDEKYLEPPDDTVEESLAEMDDNFFSFPLKPYGPAVYQRDEEEMEIHRLSYEQFHHELGNVLRVERDDISKELNLLSELASLKEMVRDCWFESEKERNEILTEQEDEFRKRMEELELERQTNPAEATPKVSRKAKKKPASKKKSKK